ncbi:hypothetical protein LCGC14_1089070 [marine sediment metagenome]|uniref:Uncharacterized protein n=1 Tax=marine sediment metagenome TaxID=412755 RepID=A0A0F9QJ05_9ZZZZ
MTDQHTPEERIALLKGWERWHGMGSDCWRHESSDGGYHNLYDGPPNYLTKEEHALPLMVEMWEAGFDLSHDNIDGTFYWYGVSDDGPDALNDDRDETTDVMVATGLDWLAWKEKEK